MYTPDEINKYISERNPNHRYCEQCGKWLTPGSHNTICRSCLCKHNHPNATVYVYGLRDPRNGLIRYVGLTIQKLEHRLSQHLASVRNMINSAKRNGWPIEYTFPCCNPKERWLLELAALNLRPEIIILESFEGASSPYGYEGYEQHWMTKLFEAGMPILNAHNLRVSHANPIQLRLLDVVTQS